jgi:putative nucleotidyltransferase with HDIG domain
MVLDKDALWYRIKKMNSLSTLPEIYDRVSDMINNPKTSAANLASVISRDETLVAKLLRVANSPFYKASPEKVTSITFAVALLGFNATKNLVLSVSIFDLFHTFEESLKLTVRGFWKHSITCAVASKIIAQNVRYKNPEEMFVSGLLHDIGKIVEIQYMPEDFKKIINVINSKEVSMKDAEEEVLKYSHTDVGKMLGIHWNLSPRIIDCMRLHHIPDKAIDNLTEVSIVHTANVLSHSLELDYKVPVLNEKAWEILNLKIDMLEPILKQLKKESLEAIAVLFPKK